ncbi:MAG: methionine synthase [Bacteroidales bacterium]|nr:methionine synthase [Bacteroidales bacterium]
MGFAEDIRERILVLDGAMGTLLQQGVGEEDILRAYVDAGVDIITTNSFNANRISLAEQGQAALAADLAFEAAVRARRVADAAGRKVYVAGSIGPTGKSLTLASNADDPAYRQYGFDAFVEAYREEIEALARGGADLIILETCFDALNAKAAIYALELLGNPLPLVISATVSDRSGRTLTGQTLEAFYRSIEHAPTLCAFGINCALGADMMAPLVTEIAGFSNHAVSFYPNAGIPDEMGCYNDSPEAMAGVIRRLAEKGLLNIVGGCCGTTPAHIKAVADAIKGLAPRRFEPRKQLIVSGLEPVLIDRSRNFTNIGERTNVAGSRKFARLIAEEKYGEALAIAAAQIEGGASVIDINMDDPMLDASERMRTFLRHIAGEPAIARAAVMIDSSHWDTILEGLKNAQGKCIVNSISLKEGEEEFLRKARTIHALGGAMVVMAFDEEGQAVTLDRKIEICERSYRLLTGAGIPPQDIVFDANVLSIGTGIEEHARFGVDFIEAVRWIKTNLPGALTSGGISNLSFAFRGNNRVREAMHSVFLYHAIKAGLDMAIVNPQMLQIYDDIEPGLRQAVEDVVFDSDPEATSRLVAKASEMLAEEPRKTEAAAVKEASGEPEERLSDAVVKGLSQNLIDDTLKCLERLGSAVAVIEGPLMAGMERVGALFGDGKMFLPQVVKSARVMREAVSVLEPYMQGGEEVGGKPKFLIATVQGDVHDIGKNITGIVLTCSGFEVTDLGVMVPADTLLDKAEEIGADIIGVSGLITPSLHRMEEICSEMSARGMRVPLFVGGAAASAVHTAVKLAPLYADVHYGSDASAAAVMAKKYMQDPAGFRAAEDAQHARLAALHAGSARHPQGTLENAASCGQTPAGYPEKPLTLRENARRVPMETPYPAGFLPGKPFTDIAPTTLGWKELRDCFDWRMFFGVCGLKCRGEDGCAESSELEHEALSILSREKPFAFVCARFLDCRRDGDDIVSIDGSLRLPMLRDGHSLADFFPEIGSAQLGLFAVRVDGGAEGDFVGHALRVCLAEAASEYLGRRWESLLPEGFRLIRPGIGYACCPDHSLKRDILATLPETGITLTDSCAMIPEASVCGLVIAHRDAAYHDIRRVTPEELASYAARRGFSEEERKLFLSHLL